MSSRLSRRLVAPTGTYVLHVLLRSGQEVVVERRGGKHGAKRRTTYLLPSGNYLYVGSAFGPGGLASRIGRHLSSGAKVRHWDIDFLLASPARACRVAAWALPSSHKDGAECRWAAAIFDAPGAKPVTGSFNGGKSERGFGAGDCRRRCGCAEGVPDAYRTHLFRVEWRPTLTRLRTLLCGRLVVASSRKGS